MHRRLRRSIRHPVCNPVPAPNPDRRHGEISARLEGRLHGYYGNERVRRHGLPPTAFSTRDAGNLLDDHGHLVVIDRPRTSLSCRTTRSPAFINKLRVSQPYSREAGRLLAGGSAPDIIASSHHQRAPATVGALPASPPSSSTTYSRPGRQPEVPSASPRQGAGPRGSAGPSGSSARAAPQAVSTPTTLDHPHPQGPPQGRQRALYTAAIIAAIAALTSAPPGGDLECRHHQDAGRRQR